MSMPRTDSDRFKLLLRQKCCPIQREMWFDRGLGFYGTILPKWSLWKRWTDLQRKMCTTTLRKNCTDKYNHCRLHIIRTNHFSGSCMWWTLSMYTFLKFHPSKFCDLFSVKLKNKALMNVHVDWTNVINKVYKSARFIFEVIRIQRS